MDLYFLELMIIKAAITPGIQPIQVNKNTINIEPHPLSKTAKGGKIRHKMTRRHDIFINQIFLIQY